MSFVNQYRSTTIYGELKVQKYNTGGVTGLLDISGNSILRGDVGVYGNLYASDGTVDVSGNLAVSGNITGTFAGTVENATNAVNTGVTGIATDASFYPTFVSGITGNLPHYVDSDLNYNPFTNTLTVANITGTCSNATTASSVNVTANGTNTTYRIPFLSATTGTADIYSDGQLLYNPNTNVLVATGGFAGNATTATDADNATNIGVSVATANASFYPTFVSATTGNLPAKVDSNLNYNPFTNTLTCTNITGTCSSATNATNVDVSTASANFDFYPTFVSAASGNYPIKVDTAFNYNPSTNVLTVPNITATNITGTCTNADLAAQVTVATVTTGTRYLGMFATGAGTRTCLIDTDLTYDAATNTLTCTNITGTASNATDAVNATNATNSTNIAVASDATNADFYPTFVSATTGNLPPKVSNDLRYNPNTNTLTVANITGTISNALNIGVATIATNQPLYPIFVTTTTGNLPPKVDADINYNPFTNTLTVPNISGTCSNITATGVSTNASYRVPFLSANTGSVSISSDGGLTYNPSTNALTASGSLTTGILYAASLSVGAGVWLIDGTNTGTLNALVPLFTSQPYLSDINDQSSLTFTRQTTDYATGGSYLNPFDNFDKIDRIMVFPKWGIVGFVDSNYATAGGILVNYKNAYDFPTFVNVTDNQMSSCKIYFNDVEQV